MIKIQSALNLDGDFALDLEQKIEGLHKHFNKIKKNNDPAKNSIINNVKMLKLNSENNSYLSTYANDCQLTLDRQRLFYDFLLENGGLKVKELIVSTPSRLKVISDEIMKILEPNDLYSIDDNGNFKNQSEFGKLILERIFKYDTYRKSMFCINLYKSICLQNITCPYCNIEQITIIPNNQNGKMLLSLDHFYPKSRYPYLAISFYNLIPSCHNCNSTIKKDKNFTIETHVNPYFESFNDLYKFNLPITSLRTLIAENLKIENLNIKPNDITPSDLELNGRYENIDLDDVNRLIKTFSDYQHYITDGKTEDLKRFIFEMHGVKKHKKDILKSPKSKLLRDIIKIFDINNALNLD